MTEEKAKKRCVSIVGLVLVLVVLSAQAKADLYGFYPITSNSGVQNTVALQLSVDITDTGSNQALFTFYNDGPAASPYDVLSPIPSNISTIYIDDDAGALSGLASITQSPVGFTDFTAGATPTNPPSANTVGFSADAALSAQRSTQAGGVNMGEYVSILYNLAVGKDFADIIDAMNTAAMRIAMHVQGIYPTGVNASDTFVTPVPGAAILGLLGLGVAGLKLRKSA